MAKNALKICLLVTIILLIMVAVAILLVFTLFKPKNPIVHLYPVGLKNMKFDPTAKSIPLSMIISVMNPNYGIYKTEDTTGYIHYKNTVVAIVPVGPKTLPGHETTNVSATAGLMSDKLMSNEHFLGDVGDGSFNLTGKVDFHGKVHLIKIFKIKATVNIFCDILFKINPFDAVSSCVTKMKV